VTKEGWTYLGQFLRGRLSGQGQLILPNNQGRYSGEFARHKFDGIGVYTFPDGVKWHGYFALGVPVGIGELIPIGPTDLFSVGTKYNPDSVKGTYEELCVGRKLVGGNIV